MGTRSSTLEMDREQWLKERRKGIGGSDTPVIVLGNDHPFTTPRELWESKLGMSGGEDKPTPAMRRGTVLEPVVADLYREATGRKLRRVNAVLQHPDHDWMLGNVDREIVAARPDDGPGVLEIKCPGLRTFSQCRREGIPDYYQLQMQHYLAVTGRKWGAFAVFSAERWDLLHFDVERDDELIDLIVERDAAFWELVKSGTPPESAEELTKVDIPPLQTDMELVRIESDAWRNAVDEYRMAKEILDEAKELESVAKERLQNLMELHGAAVAEGGGLRVYYREQAGRLSFDHKAFAKAHPDLDLAPWFKQSKPTRPFRPYFLKEERVHE